MSCPEGVSACLSEVALGCWQGHPVLWPLTPTGPLCPPSAALGARWRGSSLFLGTHWWCGDSTALGAGGRVAEEVGSYGCCCSGPLQANLVLTLGAGGAAFAGLEEGSQGSLEDEGGEPECQELL